jgi:hypothetical protein
LGNWCLTESLGFLNPPHRQAAKRWRSVETATYAEKDFERIDFCNAGKSEKVSVEIGI